MSSMFVTSQSSCFFLCSREQIRLVENRLYARTENALNSLHRFCWENFKMMKPRVPEMQFQAELPEDPSQMVVSMEMSVSSNHMSRFWLRSVQNSRKSPLFLDWVTLFIEIPLPHEICNWTTTWILGSFLFAWRKNNLYFCRNMT